MACKTIQITLASAAAQQISTTDVPFQELHLNSTTNQYYFGSSDVSSTKFFRTVLATGSAASAVIVGNGPAAIGIDNLKNLYIKGTQGDVINLGVITL